MAGEGGFAGGGGAGDGGDLPVVLFVGEGGLDVEAVVGGEWEVEEAGDLADSEGVVEGGGEVDIEEGHLRFAIADLRLRDGGMTNSRNSNDE